MMTFKRIGMIIATLFLLTACTVNKQPELKMDYEIYNAGEQSIFPVSSALFYGQNEALLIDAQFTQKDALKIIEQIKQSGKPLTLIYISHSDPDYYFGLSEIIKAYPNAKVIATKPTVATIERTISDKLKFWRAILGKDAPKQITLPTAIAGNSFVFDGHLFVIKGLESERPDRSYVWVPSLKMIVGGPLVSNNMFVWVADTRTAAERAYWMTTLNDMLSLSPEVVIPGHFYGQPPQGTEAIIFTQEYLKNFEDVLANQSSTEHVLEKMKQIYQGFGGEINLEMSTKIVRGEMVF